MPQFHVPPQVRGSNRHLSVDLFLRLSSPCCLLGAQDLPIKNSKSSVPASVHLRTVRCLGDDGEHCGRVDGFAFSIRNVSLGSEN